MDLNDSKIHQQYRDGNLGKYVNFDFWTTFQAEPYVPQPRTIATLGAEQAELHAGQTQQYFTPESFYRSEQRWFREEIDYNTWVTFDEYVALLFAGHPGDYTVMGL